MSFSAVSLGAAIGVSSLIGQPPVVTPPPVIGPPVRPAVALLESAGKPVAVVGMVDASGLYLVHRSALSGSLLTLRDPSGSVRGPAQIKAVDEVTQLALLQGPPRLGGGGLLRLAQRACAPGEEVTAWTTSGPIRGEFVAGGRVGILKPSMRYAPLSELRMETSLDKLGGALVLNTRGELVGVIHATLEIVPQRAPANAFQELSKTNQLQQFGPVGLTVAYALDRSILERVLEGLRSPDGRVAHPTIGVFFKDADGSGVVIERVVEGSCSDRAGLKAGDIVVHAGSRTISDSVSFAVWLFEQKVGSQADLTVVSGGKQREVRVVVGS